MKQYVVYDIRSTVEVASYNSLGWARRFANKKNQRLLHGVAPYDVATRENYNRYIVTTKKVRNLMTGEEVTIASNTPNCCNPATETYWSM